MKAPLKLPLKHTVTAKFVQMESVKGKRHKCVQCGKGDAWDFLWSAAPVREDSSLDAEYLCEDCAHQKLTAILRPIPVCPACDKLIRLCSCGYADANIRLAQNRGKHRPFDRDPVVCVRAVSGGQFESNRRRH